MNNCKIRSEMEMRAVKIVPCATVVLLVTSIFAGAEEEEKPSVTIASDFFSKYVWRGQLLVDDWVAQPSVSLGYKGFTASIWGNLCLTDEIDAEGEFTEFDYSLDYTAAVPGLDGLSFSLGTIYYRFPNQPFDPTLEVYGGLSADVPLSPAVKVFYDVGDNIDKDGIEGSYIQFSIGHAIEKIQSWTDECYCDLQLGASLGFGTAGYDNGFFGVDSAGLNDLTLSAALPITLGAWTVKPVLGFSTMLDSDIRAATDTSDNFYGGIGASYSF
jgi:hypothetical protein